MIFSKGSPLESHYNSLDVSSKYKILFVSTLKREREKEEEEKKKIKILNTNIGGLFVLGQKIK